MAALLLYPIPQDQPFDEGEWFRKNLSAVEAAAYRVKTQMQLTDDSILVEDLVQEGFIGLVRASERFLYDPTNESPLERQFTTYAIHRVEGAMRDYAREQFSVSRKTYAQLSSFKKEWEQAHPGEEFISSYRGVPEGFAEHDTEALQRLYSVFYVGVASLSDYLTDQGEYRVSASTDGWLSPSPWAMEEQYIDYLHHKQQRVFFIQALHRLPAYLRIVVVGAILLDLGPTNLSRVCGVTPDAISHAVRRAIRRLAFEVTAMQGGSSAPSLGKGSSPLPSRSRSWVSTLDRILMAQWQSRSLC